MKSIKPHYRWVNGLKVWSLRGSLTVWKAYGFPKYLYPNWKMEIDQTILGHRSII